MATVTNTIITKFKSDLAQLKSQNKLLSMTTKEAMKSISANKKAMSEQQKLTSMTSKQAQAAISSSAKKEMALEKVRAKVMGLVNAERMAQNRTAAIGRIMKQTGIKNANQLATGMKKAGFSMDKAGNVMDAFGRKVKLTGKDLKDITKKSRGFNMALLSVMFAGMALQKAMGGFLRSAITSFQRANEDTEGMGKATWELSAAWEFFKYSLIAALSQSDLFMMMVEWLVQVVQWFNKLTPASKTFIILSAMVLFAVGTIMLLVGQIGLAVIGFLALGITVGVVFAWFIILALIIAGLIFIFQGVMDIINYWGKDTKKVIMGIMKVIIGLGLVVAGVALIMGAVMTAGIALIVVAIAAAVFLIIKYWDQIKNAWEITWAWIKNVFITIWNWIVSYYENGINIMIKGLNAMIGMINKIPGINIPIIPEVDFSGVKGELIDIQAIKDRQAAEMAAKLAMQEAAPTDTQAGLASTNNTSNVSQVNNNTFQLPENMSMDEIYNFVQTKQDEELSREIDTSNN